MNYDEYDGPSRESMRSKPKRLSWAEKQEDQAKIDEMQLRRKARNRENVRRRRPER